MELFLDLCWLILSSLIHQQEFCCLKNYERSQDLIFLSTHVYNSLTLMWAQGGDINVT